MRPKVAGSGVPELTVRSRATGPSKLKNAEPPPAAMPPPPKFTAPEKLLAGVKVTP